MDEIDSAGRKNMQLFVEHLLANTVNLVRVGQNMEPVGVCSGVLVRKKENVFLLSAYYGLKKGRYTLETNLVLEGSGQTVAIPLNSIFHTERLKLKPHSLDVDCTEEIDFAWCKRDLKRVQRDMATNSELRGKAIELPVYEGPLSDKPEKDMPYGYAAWNRVQLINGAASYLERSASYELALSYDGFDSALGLYRFALARQHQGFGYYKGASGAPIADPTGKIVSLVIAGREGEPFLWGLPLADYQHFLDLEQC